MEFRASLAVRRFIPFYEWLLPVDLRKHPTELWKAENLIIAALMATLIMPLYGLLYLALGETVNAALCMCATAGSCVALAALRAKKRVLLSRELLVVTIFGLLLAMTSRLGGVEAPTVIWLAVCPLIATTVGGLRPALNWASLSFLAVVAIHFIDAAGLFPAPGIENMRLLTTVSTLSFVLTVAIFVMLFYQVNSSAVLRLDQALTVIQDLANRDELTGIFNRRELLRMAEQQKGQAQRFGTPFSLCLIDVDHFKRINDTYGHAAGDHVLKRVAARVQEEIRKTDCFGRYGGEEFLLLLVGSDAEAAKLLNERIRQVVENMRFSEMPDLQKVTISIGVAEYRIGETIEQALSRADTALYAAKGAGRNRVIVASDGAPSARAAGRAPARTSCSS